MLGGVGGSRSNAGPIPMALLSRLFVLVTVRWDQTRARRESSIVDILIELFLPTHAAQRADQRTRIRIFRDHTAKCQRSHPGCLRMEFADRGYALMR